jgi:anaerobic selenocysteine-containing dehydrogenase
MYEKLKEERERAQVWSRGGSKDYWAYTVCGGCYGLCSAYVHVVDGVPVQIESIVDSDMGGRGGMCGKGTATIMDYHDPNRVNYPVRRTNPKKGPYEDPKWERISWEEAMETIAEKMKAIREDNPKKVVWAFTPGPGTALKATQSVGGFFMSFGSPNIALGGAGTHCGAVAHHLGALVHAGWDILPDYRYNNFLIRCGGNEGVGGGRMAMTAVRQFAEARDRGQRTVVLDPIGYQAGGKAQEYIPILPCTDIAVFLAIANLIVNEIRVFDEVYIRDKTNGPYLVGPDRTFVRDKESKKPLLWDEKDGRAKTYDDPTLSRPALTGEYIVNGIKCRPAFQIIKEHLVQYKPDWASKISTVPESTIRRLAQQLVEEAKIGSTIEIKGVKIPYRPVGLCAYKGFQGHQNSFHQYAAMYLINSLLGNQDVAGGIVGSGTVRSLGHPDTGGFRFAPYPSHDGMLTPAVWHTRTPWPPREPKGPEFINLLDLFSDSSFTPYPYAEDWDEIWTKAGRPYEPELFFVYGSNVVTNVCNPEIVANFLRKVPFVFAITTIHNETTEGFADIVVPETHHLESLEIWSSVGFFFNYPIGMDKWSFHLRMPVVVPKYERRDGMDILLDIAERVGFRDRFNEWIDTYLSIKEAKWEQAGAKDIGVRAETKVKVFPIVRPEEKISFQEIIDRTLKYHFGKEKGLDWFMKHGYITWEKRPEECYWRYFIPARIPIYYETHEHTLPKLKELCEKVGVEFDWNQWTALVSYFPDVLYTEEPWPDSEYDLIAISHRDVLHTHRTSAQNPWVDAMSKSNPYTYQWVMHEEMAAKKGIAEGDWICVENLVGDKVMGQVKLTKLIHPNVIGGVGLGGWARGRPIARGKGVRFNTLLRSSHKRICAITSSFESGARVKAYKIPDDKVDELRKELHMEEATTGEIKDAAKKVAKEAKK